MKADFPINGLHRGLPAETQMPNTSFSLVNVRPVDVTSDRLRGGKRPGYKKEYTGPAGVAIGGTTAINGHPCLYITSVVTTYIEPV